MQLRKLFSSKAAVSTARGLASPDEGYHAVAMFQGRLVIFSIWVGRALDSCGGGFKRETFSLSMGIDLDFAKHRSVASSTQYYTVGRPTAPDYAMLKKTI